MLKSFSGIIFLFLLVASVFIPVNIPYSFDSTAKVYPLQRWVLQKNADGTLVSSLHNYKTGALQNYSSFQFDRGDVVNIEFNPHRITNKRVEEGELIAAIASNILAERLVQLTNDLNIEKANLKKQKAGEKIQIINSRQEELRLANQEKSYAQTNYERARNLYTEGLIALSELEAVATARKEAQIRVDLAKKRMSVSNTGEKPEQLNLINARIGSLKKEINFLKSKNNDYAIFSPLAGKLRFETDIEGDRLVVEDTLEHILFVPIKLKDKDFINKESVVELNLPGIDTLIKAELLDIDDKVEIIGRNLVVVAKAKVNGDIPGLASGMPIKCKITCGKVKPLEFLKRSMTVDMK